MASEKKVKLLIVEDEPRFLKNQIKLLSGSEWIEIVGSALNGETAISLIKKKKPDIILLDLGLPDIDGINLTRMIKELSPKTEVLIFTIFDEEQKVMDAIRAGASGYILKGSDTNKIKDAIKDVMAGGSVIQPTLARSILRHLKTQPPEEEPILTERQKEILQLISKGLSNRETARILNLSPSTIRTHLEYIYRKLDVSGRVEAIAEGIRKGIIEI